MAISHGNAIIRICVMGDVQVGKSSLCGRYVDDIFDEGYEATIGVDFNIKVLKVRDYDAKLQIWDMAGHERFRCICTSYLRNCKAIIIVYDVTKKDSFVNVGNWLDWVRAHATSDVPTALVANKCDDDNMRVVLTEEGRKLAENNGLLFKEVSAKSGEHVKELFSELAHQVEFEEIDLEDNRRRAAMSMPSGRRAAFCLIL